MCVLREIRNCNWKQLNMVLKLCVSITRVPDFRRLCLLRSNKNNSNNNDNGAKCVTHFGVTAYVNVASIVIIRNDVNGLIGVLCRVVGVLCRVVTKSLKVIVTGGNVAHFCMYELRTVSRSCGDYQLRLLDQNIGKCFFSHNTLLTYTHAHTYVQHLLLSVLVSIDEGIVLCLFCW